MSIYLIGGAPKCGKTTLAKYLSKKWGISWISADTLQNIAWAYTEKTHKKEAFPHRYLKGSSTEDLYETNTTQQVVEAYIKQANISKKAIKMMVETYTKDKDNIIIEGYQITPQLCQEIQQKYPKEEINILFLEKIDKKLFIESVEKTTNANDWVKRIKSQKTRQNIAQMVVFFSKWFKKEATKYNFFVYNTDGNFKEVFEEIESKPW